MINPVNCVQKIRKSSGYSYGVLLLAWLFFVGSGFYGLEFGYHWDEDKSLKSVFQAYKTGHFLPGWYQYPSLLFSIGCIVNFLCSAWAQITEFVIDLKLAWRGSMILLSSLSGFVVFDFVKSWRGDQKRALMTALVLLSSFELSYHSRWIAPDTLVLLFGMTTFSCLARAVNAQQSSRKWYALAAIAAGCACGSKYPGGLFLLPLISVVLFDSKLSDLVTARVRFVLTLSLIFSFTVLAITPGLIFDFTKAVTDIQYEISHYAKGHGPYSVEPGTFHLAKIGQYLLGVFPSYFSIFAFLLAGFALAGFFRSIIEGSPLGWALVATFCLYVFYFSQQRVMIVRNLLVLFPIVAIWVAEGVHWCLSRLRRLQGLAEIIIVCLVAGFGANTYFIAVQSSVIRHRVPVQSDWEKLSTNPELEHRDSSGKTQRDQIDNRESIFVQKSKAGQVEQSLFRTDGAKRTNWIANRAHVYRTLGGPGEVNWSYYPTWRGPARVLLVSPLIGKELRVWESNRQATLKDNDPGQLRNRKK